MFASLIVPTYNRPESLAHTLESIAGQDYKHLEVIVVDDGSTRTPDEVVRRGWPFTLRYEPQPHRGGTSTKNAGASAARGDLLIFLDDDIRIAPDFVSQIVQAHSQHDRAIITGKLVDIPAENETAFSNVRLYHIERMPGEDSLVEIPFYEILGGFFSIKRSHFFELGMLEGVGDGWPNWEDVILGFKAHKAGFITLRAIPAVGRHYDASRSTLRSTRDRWYRASRVAPLLFHACPGLEDHLDMYFNKTPIRWGHDSWKQVVKKLGYQAGAVRPILWIVEKLVIGLESVSPSLPVLERLYRWIVGGYMIRGYRAGLREFNTNPWAPKQEASLS